MRLQSFFCKRETLEGLESSLVEFSRLTKDLLVRRHQRRSRLVTKELLLPPPRLIFSTFIFELRTSYNGINLSKIQPQQKQMQKTVLRFIGEKEVRRYLVPKEARVALGYPPSCLEEWQGEASWDEMVGMSNASFNYEYPRWGRRRGEDQKEQNFSQLVICNRALEVIFKADRETPLDDQITREEEKVIPGLRSQVQTAIAGKIIVGYNLGPLLTKLQISHSRFIDIAHLYPEVTPKKQPLSRLAKEILGVKMSHQGKYRNERFHYRERMDNRDDPDSSDDQRRQQRRIQKLHPRMGEDSSRFVISTEAANVCLKIAEKHIEEGRGILTTEPTRKGEFRNVDEMLEQAEIKKEEVCGLFLRGSRAMDIHVVNEDYKSDWDYVCVLDTAAVINSILVRLPYVDLLLFDRRSFMIYVNGGDLPMIELFSLPSHCIYVNRLPKPIISIRNSKYSLIYHVQKADQKIRYYSPTFYQSFFPNRDYHYTPSILEDRPQEDIRGERLRYQGRRNRNGIVSQNHELLEMQGSSVGSKENPKYVQWKFIKIMHMQVRFLDLYLQIRQKGRIVDPLAKTSFWKQLQAICLTRGHFAAYQVCKDEFNRLLTQVFSLNELESHYFTLYKAEQDSRLYYQRRDREGRGYRGDRDYPRRMRDEGYRGRGRYNRYRRSARRDWEDYQILSVYRRIAPVSYGHYGGDIHRIDDVDNCEYYRGGRCRRGGYRRQYEGNSRSPQMMLLNTTTLDRAVLKQSSFFKLLRNRINQEYSQIQTQLFSYYLEPQHFYSINYIQRQGRQPPEDEVANLINFLPQEHANMESELVQEASACIMRCHLTELQEKTAVYTLVCFMYKPFLEYGSIKRDREAVSAFEGRNFDVFEKRDGVLTALYFSKAGWVIGTKRTPDGREYISPAEELTVFDEFSRVFRQLGYKMPVERHRNKAFLFQLLSTKISNTVPKSKDELILHGVRNMRTLQEEDPQYYASQYGWMCASTLTLNTKSLQEIAQIVESKPDCQGFILRDSAYNRLVIRNSSILKIKWQKKMEETMQMPKQALIDANKKIYFLYSQIVIKKRHQEYLQLFPDDQQIIQGILQYLQEVSSECLRLNEQVGKRELQQPEVDQLIVDKRIDILTYLLSQRMREQNGLSSNNLHTTIDFNQAFSFLLQHLHNRTIPT